MQSEFQIHPDLASTFAWQVDGLYFLMVGLSIFFTVGVAFVIVLFSIKYRRRSEDERPKPVHGSMALELAWSIIPLILCVGIFTLGAEVFFRMYRMPEEGIDIYVVGKQWMWKIQHPEGKREINELHVPVDTPVRLTLASEDVIHAFSIPAFRTKRDVVPGRYTTMWFEATKTGDYHLFCAEFCGTQHSGMIGKVVVMEPEDYQNWLGGGVSGESLVEAG
ncbi:MAG: cytochrome c oxidase subunit II, partial [Candidatus Latescibacterota bacterium]|nr:cytochrome c oxidase subunit II [Candidatus Latescibacterota bacterium]